MGITKRDFNKLDIDSQINYFNSKLKEENSISFICKEIGISYNTIRDRFNRHNYIYNKYLKQYESTSSIFDDDVAFEKVIEKIINKTLQINSAKTSNELICSEKGKVINRSFRVYDSVLNDFIDFCSNSGYNQYDILSTFISDGINKYSKKIETF